MSTPHARNLPGGPARRDSPSGVRAGAPLTRIRGPVDALGLVAADLVDAERALRDVIRSEVAAVPEVSGYLVEAGGKRLRPALTALGARAVGWEGPLGRLMAIGELIHLGSLLHDDVVDDGITRRDQPAAHRVYGNAVTVLTGDFCLARAMLLAAEEGGHRAVTELGRAVTEMAEGEVLQLQRAGDLDCPIDDYFEWIEKKSAALIAWCCAAGAWARGDEAAATALRRFGRAVGLAFQITDDVLDYQADTGKAAGADLMQRKVTLPLLLAFESDPGLREQLAERAPARDELPLLIARVRATGALEGALADARRRVEAAMSALEAVPSGEHRDALAVLGAYLVERAR